MENEAGPQLATYGSSYFSNLFPPGHFYDSLKQRQGGRQADWNVNSWDWNSVLFVAKPANDPTDRCEDLNRSPDNHEEAPSETLRLGSDETVNPCSSQGHKRKQYSFEDDAESLTLKLGGSAYADDSNSKNSNKRFRSGSGIAYPICQVDDCRTDLTNAKDYHRRHKVCQQHSKASKALVCNVMQRFCQQCSRFHTLQEFDEGKRSCRRRLAGHNKRRRKTQYEEAPCRRSSPAGDNGTLGNLDIAKIVSILSRQLEANNNSMDESGGPMVLDRDYLVQCLSKLNSGSSSEDFRRDTAVSQKAFDHNISQNTQRQAQRSDAEAQFSQAHGLQSPALNSELLERFSVLAGRSPQVLSALQRSLVIPPKNQIRRSLNPQLTNQLKPNLLLSGMVHGRTSTGAHDGASEISTSRGGVTLPLQLFDTSVDNGRSFLAAERQFFTQDRVNPMEERSSSRSPSSSPPVVQKLFPLHSRAESKENDNDELTLEAGPVNDGPESVERNHLQKASPSYPQSGSDPSVHGYTSSGSDQSPTSSNSVSQGRTGRIIFKLFDKGPTDIPLMLRNQILEWLSHSPSDMESYIRPGCMILTIFASMPSAAWEQLREDLQQRLKLLLAKDGGSNFWRSGRIIVQAEQRLASIQNGRIRLCRSWRSWKAPEIHSVRPIAVVAGEETNLTLRGHNLRVPGTKILCAYRGKYSSLQVVIPEEHQTGYRPLFPESATIQHKFSGGPLNVLGRCFIEVEHGLKGNSFPVIVADNAICRELRTLEDDIEGQIHENKSCTVMQGHSKLDSQDDPQFSTRGNIITFLNELGWLFQRNSYSVKEPVAPKFEPWRFKIILTHTVERDWNSLLKKVLDIFFDMNSGEGSMQEALDVLSEMNLLHRAVKRKCRQIVELLLHYKPSLSGSNGFWFSPNLVGPGGLTPLHLAANMQDAEDIVDALTNDPQKVKTRDFGLCVQSIIDRRLNFDKILAFLQIGLQAWSTALDASQQTPHAYALMRNNHSYNRLVARKWADRIGDQISITIWKEEASLNECGREESNGTVDSSMQLSELPLQKLPLSCAVCSRLGTKRVVRMPGNRGALYRPFVHSILAIAAVCVCVCLLFKGPPSAGSIAPFKWEAIHFGSV